MQVVRRLPGRDPSWLYGLLVLTCGIASMAAVVRGLIGAWTPGSVVFLAVAALTVLVARFLRPLPPVTSVRRAQVSFSSRGISVAGSRFIEVSKIAQAYIATEDSGARFLYCRDDHGRVLFQADVSDDADAGEMLDVLGLDPARRQELGRLTALLARGERPLDAWRADLVHHRHGAYRDAPLAEEALWRVVEDPRTAEDARAAAAVLLRDGRAGEEASSRLRVAAEEASPRLRVALLAAADPAAAADAVLEPFAERRFSNG